MDKFLHNIYRINRPTRPKENALLPTSRQQRNPHQHPPSAPACAFPPPVPFLLQGKQAQMGKHKELNLTDWKPPTDSVSLSYREWLELALKHGKGDGEHWYFRVGDANNKVRLGLGLEGYG